MPSRKQSRSRVTRPTKRNFNFWPFGSRVTSDPPPPRKLKRETFHGYTVKELESGEWVVPELDRESVFETKGEAQRFVRMWEPRRARGKRTKMANSKRLNPSTRTIPAKISVDERGRIKVYANPKHLTKPNSFFGLSGKRKRDEHDIVPINKERYERDIRPLLREPYKHYDYAEYRKSRVGKGPLWMLYRNGRLVKALSSKSELKRWANNYPTVR
jgi:hypothetical protein